MLNLKEIFGDQNRAGRQVAMKALLNTKMAEGTLVRDHVLNMIAYLNELEILGAKIDGEAQVDIVLMTKGSLAIRNTYRWWRKVLKLLKRRKEKDSQTRG